MRPSTRKLLIIRLSDYIEDFRNGDPTSNLYKKKIFCQYFFRAKMFRYHHITALLPAIARKWHYIITIEIPLNMLCLNSHERNSSNQLYHFHIFSYLTP